MSKLWWCGRLTYDEQMKDTFELTIYLIDDYATKMLIIFSNNYISNHDITVGLFSALKYLENIGYKIKGKNHRDVYYEVTKYLNVLGGNIHIRLFYIRRIRTKDYKIYDVN